MAIGQITNGNSNLQISKKQTKQTETKEQNLWDNKAQQVKEGNKDEVLLTTSDGKELTAQNIEAETQKTQQEIQNITTQTGEKHKQVKGTVEQTIQEQENTAQEYAAFVENTINAGQEQVKGVSSEEERDTVASQMQDKIQERAGGFGPKAMKFIGTLVEQIYGVADIEKNLDSIKDLGKDLKDAAKITKKEVKLPSSIEKLTTETDKLSKRLDGAWGVFGTMVDTVLDSNRKGVGAIEQISGKPFQEKQKPGQTFNQAA